MTIRKITIYFWIACLSLSLPLCAQNRQKGKKVATKVQQTIRKHNTPTNALFREMLPATAKLMFVDSIIVDKKDFLKQIPLDKEAGEIVATKDFLGDSQTSEAFVFINGIGNRAFLTKGDTLQTAIYTADRLGKKWTQPTPITAIDDTYQQPNYPFMMTDGTTLYFAAKGNRSIGGYDLFVTRYNSAQHSFYQPENMGLPYNSTANDYLLAIDDANELGWLVTDRNMPEEKVCIYTFVPTKQRFSYERDNLTTKQLEAQAQISSIASTWQNGDREAALKRLKQLIAHNKPKNHSPKELKFVINDDVTLRSINDFKAINRAKVSRFLELQTDYNRQDKELLSLRDSYANATRAEKQTLTKIIIEREKALEQLQINIIKLEKEIRNNENLK